jgi:uncharacterized protein (DUF58 family)
MTTRQPGDPALPGGSPGLFPGRTARPAKSPSSPLDPEVLARLKGLKVQASRVVEGVLAGLHRSLRHGESVDFAEHKEYSPGDDLRHLDWRVLGRSDRYYVKKYEAETNLRAVLALDFSGSMAYASGPFSKAGYAALLAASLATLLLRQGDSVGLILQSGSNPTLIPPAGRPEHLTDLVQAIETTQPHGPTRLRQVARQYGEHAGRRGMLVMFSDLFDPDPDMLGSLKMLAARGHEVVIFHILDRDEIEFPFEEPVVFESMEDDRSLQVFPRQLRNAYLEEMRVFLDGTRRALAEGGLAYEQVRTDEPPHQPLIRQLSGHRTGARQSPTTRKT